MMIVTCVYVWAGQNGWESHHERRTWYVLFCRKWRLCESMPLNQATNWTKETWAFLVFLPLLFSLAVCKTISLLKYSSQNHFRIYHFKSIDLTFCSNYQVSAIVAAALALIKINFYCFFVDIFSMHCMHVTANAFVLWNSVFEICMCVQKCKWKLQSAGAS